MAAHTNFRTEQTLAKTIKQNLSVPAKMTRIRHLANPERRH
jgi:ribosomal protein L39E